MATGNYTWEEVLFSLDTRQEALDKQAQIEAIEEEQLAEDKAAGLWSLGLSLLGGAIFGPAGYFVGKQFGKYGADIAHDWETMTVDPGKFNVADIKKFNKSIAKAADDQTQGQMVNSLIDLGTMYVQAGGLKEGLGADFTTFGTGGVEGGEWSVRGKGTPGQAGFQLPVSEVGEVTSFIDMPSVPATEDYVPSILEGWGKDKSLWTNIKDVSKTARPKLTTAAGQESLVQKLINTLYEG